MEEKRISFWERERRIRSFVFVQSIFELRGWEDNHPDLVMKESIRVVGAFRKTKWQLPNREFLLRLRNIVTQDLLSFNC